MISRVSLCATLMMLAALGLIHVGDHNTQGYWDRIDRQQIQKP